MNFKEKSVFSDAYSSSGQVSRKAHFKHSLSQQDTPAHTDTRIGGSDTAFALLKEMENFLLISVESGEHASMPVLHDFLHISLSQLFHHQILQSSTQCQSEISHFHRETAGAKRSKPVLIY